MLTETEMQFFTTIINRLEADGEDVTALKKLLAKERSKINEVMSTDLINYFPITRDIMTKINEVEYGTGRLKVDIDVLLTRESGIFDKNARPELFESVLCNAISECLRNIKTEYKEEVDKLKVQLEQDMITASHDHPIILTIGTMTLYVEEGQIDRSLAWEVDSYEDSTKEMTLKAGTIIKTLKIARGDYVPGGVKTVVITQG